MAPRFARRTVPTSHLMLLPAIHICSPRYARLTLLLTHATLHQHLSHVYLFGDLRSPHMCLKINTSHNVLYIRVARGFFLINIGNFVDIATSRYLLPSLRSGRMILGSSRSARLEFTRLPPLGDLRSPRIKYHSATFGRLA
ncbi:hypothetical protein RDWZM_010284 [Blomia tropicalis]|uniref:Uncharacterized protein n=1 Tax=Blomia tropicalis TaxID=40697 RepID=A0A9Q0RIJ1_BLOTA|nr:hypothetical protein RDWZM_010284 [Blomia tropicalis]